MALSVSVRKTQDWAMGFQSRPRLASTHSTVHGSVCFGVHIREARSARRKSYAGSIGTSSGGLGSHGGGHGLLPWRASAARRTSVELHGTHFHPAFSARSRSALQRGARRREATLCRRRLISGALHLRFRDCADSNSDLASSSTPADRNRCTAVVDATVARSVPAAERWAVERL